MSGFDNDILGDRRRALEDQFFADQDKKLLEKMRKELHALEEKKKLTHVSGIVEEKVLGDLLSVGVRAETLAAVRLIPMIETAWSDGSITAEERREILKLAHENGMQAGTAAHDLLEKWLERRPLGQVFESWKEYVVELHKVMPRESFQKLRDQALERCRAVAGASGGFMGLGRISNAEADKIDEIVRALSGY
ncbi:MAG: hypothetical protein JNM84_24675 [Planctomycetes bacterium]|nr:hypothetical protein [Planctomycetota bacterium]